MSESRFGAGRVRSKRKFKIEETLSGQTELSSCKETERGRQESSPRCETTTPVDCAGRGGRRGRAGGAGARQIVPMMRRLPEGCRRQATPGRAELERLYRSLPTFCFICSEIR